MIEIGVKGLKKSFGLQVVLEDVNFEIKSGEKVGLIGGNGSGKSTTFRILSGLLEPDGGQVTFRKGLKTALLEQNPDYPAEFSALDVINEAFSELEGIKGQMDELEERMGSGDEQLIRLYSELQERYEASGGYTRENRLDQICWGLKIDEELRGRPFAGLSGGEKTTVLLARILLTAPDLLLLDEPTNHLDMEALEWLEEYLKRFEGAVVIISHDRFFLDRVVRKIVELENGGSAIYHSNYSGYVREKEERLQAEYEQFKSQEKKIKKMEEAIKRFKDWGRRADNEKMFKKAASLEKLLAKMERIEKPQLEKRKMGLNLEGGSRSGKDVLEFKGVTKGFDGVNLLEEVDLELKYRERMALLGRNGTGKSTLFKMVLGQQNADGGEIRLGSQVRIGYLEQEPFTEVGEVRLIDLFREEVALAEGEARQFLAKFLFYGDSVFKQVSALSGGEKVRLKLATLMTKDTNLLILDEPTNHMDIDSREMLEETLAEFKGTILFISHDRYFINKLAGRIVEFENKRLVNYNGNYSYFRAEKEKRRARAQERIEVQPVVVEESPTALDYERQREQKREIRKLERELKDLEARIDGVENEIAAIDEESSRGDIPFERQNELYEGRLVKEKELEELLLEWESLAHSMAN